MYYSVFELQEMSAKVLAWAKDEKFFLFIKDKIVTLPEKYERFLLQTAPDYVSIYNCLVSDVKHLDHYLSYMNYVLEKVLVEKDGDDLTEALFILYDLITHDEEEIPAILDSVNGSEISCRIKFVIIERYHNEYEQLKSTETC